MHWSEERNVSGLSIKSWTEISELLHAVMIKSDSWYEGHKSHRQGPALFSSCSGRRNHQGPSK